MLRQSQRVACWSLLTLLAAGAGGVVARAQGNPNPLSPATSAILTPAVPLAECPGGVVQFTLKEESDGKGGIKGKLILDPNRRTYNEFGEVTGVTERGLIELEYTLKFLKKKKGNIGPRPLGEERLVYEIRGQKIMTRLLLVRSAAPNGFSQLLVPGQDGRVAYVVNLHQVQVQQIFPEPCHPGCFPAGTPVQTPQGPRSIHLLRAGDVVTTIRSDGTTAPGRVQTVSVTRNQLVKVTTEGGDLLTTQTQPLVLANGKLREAGELKSGDQVFQWQQGKRRAVKVLGVTLTGQEKQVFNLVLGGSEVFVAGGFLARSKPPAGTVVSALPAALPGSKE